MDLVALVFLPLGSPEPFMPDPAEPETGPLVWVARVVIVTLLAGAVWWGLQPRYRFMVSIEGGIARSTRGLVTPVFLRAVSDLCGREGVSHGWIGGVQRGGRTHLVFSRHIPPSCQQQLRNVWQLHG
jgi:hypothetical protein